MDDVNEPRVRHPCYVQLLKVLKRGEVGKRFLDDVGSRRRDP